MAAVENEGRKGAVDSVNTKMDKYFSVFLCINRVGAAMQMRF